MARGRMDIDYDILKAAGKEGRKKSHMMYDCNLSSNSITEYLENLIGPGLLEVVGAGRGAVYKRTQKGDEFIRQYESTKKFLEL